jgi:hypothetical protein
VSTNPSLEAFWQNEPKSGSASRLRFPGNRAISCSFLHECQNRSARDIADATIDDNPLTSTLLQADAAPAKIDKGELTISERRRHRDKAHLKFVASQP